ncbi:hypothetical protein CHLNCDRAFT_136804 [Chlorella variabilis]|uniref:Bifunctional inhibitor/plant lipid transfer protein/seed storage helical domain-containing protein n=1 Tax=Chlorella variabilis TaxID=554065 RepID=E1ZL37_CHLVA|nr:hypothetical protein CHLNCDRAFT_136804 [Chlorella variabilis]EFN53591.1 hypothetical protein CHLNCDRAFT_136804 [Chlorella variabilis]|eukprot:XP_005845693.1 hypothetical protein CHLNCDRAFT_136804 [Chlorella variabilis]
MAAYRSLALISLLGLLAAAGETRAILISADCAQSLYPALSSCRADTVAAAATLPGCCSGLQALAQDCINQALFYVGDDAQAVQSGSDELQQLFGACGIASVTITPVANITDLPGDLSGGPPVDTPPINTPDTTVTDTTGNGGSPPPPVDCVSAAGGATDSCSADGDVAPGTLCCTSLEALGVDCLNDYSDAVAADDAQAAALAQLLEGCEIDLAGINNSTLIS